MAGDPHALLQKAERALKGASGGWSIFGDRSEKYENAAELFKQAANAFRMQKLNKEAGQALERAVQIYTTNLKDPIEATRALDDAFKVYRKSDPDDAARVLSTLIQHYVTTGELRRAATQQQHLAELYEVQLGDTKRALEAYEQTAEWFDEENSPALANKHYMKAADLAAREGEYERAIKHYVRQAEAIVRSPDMNALKFSVVDYLTKASICHLAMDFVTAEREIPTYVAIDPSFEDPHTGVRDILVGMAVAIKNGDHDAFTYLTEQLSRRKRLADWQGQVLDDIAKGLEAPKDDFA